ncbi:MAG: M48 family metalloprotease [Rubricoccaceae bacterium]|nr:M48 family metalloprotease [Rubricoccaceae bacterium]
MPLRTLLPALLLALPVAAGCGGDSVNRGDLNLMSLDQEWALGAELAAEVAAQVRFVEDPAVQAYVEAMGQALVAETEMADRPWRFYVVADPAVNAFAIPGGHVYVNAGLIAAAENAAELASVVGHEVAHGVARHATERMVKAYGLQLVAGLVLGEDAGFLEEVVTALLGQGLLARFSRADEQEADRLGLVFMADAGYAPEAMAGMFETLLVLRQRRPLLFERWLQTHPLTEDRIEWAEAAARDVPAADRRLTDPAFARIQQRVARYAEPLL